MKRIGTIVGHVIEPLLNKQGFVCGRIVTHWSDIVGPQFSDIAAPSKITFPMGKKNEGTLHLITTSAGAMMIQYAEPLILERINTFFGYKAVIKLRFQMSKINEPL